MTAKTTTGALGQRLADADAAGDVRPYEDYLVTATGVAAIAAAKQARDGLLGIGPGSRVLDVCCGLGDDARRVAELVRPGGAVVGLDSSQALLERAREAGPELTWVLGDAHELPFETASFDAARVERALQHLAEPGRALAEMVRVVRPGGVVLACEPDWATFSLSADRQDLVDGMRAAAETAIAHPRIGRALPALLADAGLEAVEVASESIALRDFPVLSALSDLPALTDVMVHDGTAGREELDALVAQLEADGAAGRLLGTMTLVSAWGRVI